MKDLFLKNKYYYSVIILFVIVEGIILYLITKDQFTLWVNTRWTLFLDKFFLIINNIGAVFFSVTTVILLWLLKGWRIALKAAICFFSVMLVTQFAKHLLFPGVPRPTLYFEENTLRLIEGVKQLSTESFPSGHTSAAFSLSTFFALFLPKKKWHWLLAVSALLVGYGHIYLSQHFITDVYAGMIVGVVVTSLVYFLYPKSWEKT